MKSSILSDAYDYNKVESEAADKLNKVAKKTGIEAFEKTDPKEMHARRVNSRVARQITDKCIEDYMEGECDWKSTVKDICSAFEALL